VKENTLKRAIRENHVAIGTSLSALASREIATVLEQAGLDWVMVDMLSSGFTMDTLADLVAWFKATPITVIVRPPNALATTLSAILDVGAMGIVAPIVETAGAARAIVDAVMYPPLGNRGVSLNNAHSNYNKCPLAEYMPARNAQTSIVVLIESKQGLDNVEEIAAVEGIDVIQPSHNDLTVALGIPDQYEHPAYKAALRKVADACRKHGKALKFNPYTDAQVKECYEMGCRIMGVRHVVIALREAMTGDVQHLRALDASISRS
jgi:2-keto-3-deoxy-L-rhamnonate aldolase RhmA